GRLGEQRPPDVGRHGRVQVDEVAGVSLQLRVDRVGHLLGERAVRPAGERTVQVTAGEALERAHPRLGPERGDVQNGEGDDGAREGYRVELTHEAVHNERAERLVTV